MADNFHFDLTGVALETGLEIAFGGRRKMVGWYVQEPGDAPRCRSYQSMQDALVKAELIEPITEEEVKRLRGKTEHGRLAHKVTWSMHEDGWELRPIARRDPAVPRMVLFWSDFDSKSVIQKLPAPMTAAEAAPFIKSWLATVSAGSQPDHDGDNEVGVRVYNEAWTHIGSWHSAFCAVEPVWLMYGK